MNKLSCNVDWFKYENECAEEGYEVVCGVDEAGRGPLAGPVYAGAVILEKGNIIDGVNDSKKLSESKREKLYDVITQRALAWSVGFADQNEIDEINILNATFLAMKRAVNGLSVKPEVVLVDGNRLPDFGLPSKAIVKGDSLSCSIACASILAKVSRDRVMKKMAAKYPEYGFEKHKGYGTKLHIECIKKYGPCPIHRRTFLKNVLKVNE